MHPATSQQSVCRCQSKAYSTNLIFVEYAYAHLPALGVDAQSLHHLNYLIAEPIPAAVLYRSGVLVQVPRPERLAIHKLIVSQQRLGGPDALKSRKDLLQAEFLISVLAEDRPEDLAEAYNDAVTRGPKWRKHIENALERSNIIKTHLSIS